MKNERNIKLLVTPYVHSFLLEEFGTVDFYVRQTSVLARSITSCIIFKTIQKKEKEGCFINIQLNARMSNYYGLILKMAKRHYFFDDLFKEKFFSFVDALIVSGHSKSDSIRVFCSCYKITSEMIDQSILYRIHTKHKSKRKKIEKSRYESVLTQNN
jgi:hypothetical protein